LLCNIRRYERINVGFLACNCLVFVTSSPSSTNRLFPAVFLSRCGFYKQLPVQLGRFLKFKKIKCAWLSMQVLQLRNVLLLCNYHVCNLTVNFYGKRCSDRQRWFEKCKLHHDCCIFWQIKTWRRNNLMTSWEINYENLRFIVKFNKRRGKKSVKFVLLIFLKATVFRLIWLFTNLMQAYYILKNCHF
jgi:hypothetical protein